MPNCGQSRTARWRIALDLFGIVPSAARLARMSPVQSPQPPPWTSPSVLETQTAGADMSRPPAQRHRDPHRRHVLEDRQCPQRNTHVLEVILAIAREVTDRSID